MYSMSLAWMGGEEEIDVVTVSTTVVVVTALTLLGKICHDGRSEWSESMFESVRIPTVGTSN
jgi:hypothetical protein